MRLSEAAVDGGGGGGLGRADRVGGMEKDLVMRYWELSKMWEGKWGTSASIKRLMGQ